MAHVTAATGAGPRRTVITDAGIAGLLVTLALVGWWWSVRMADDMAGMEHTGAMGTMSMSASLSMAAYIVGWVAMMAAMMFPAIAPVVRLYSRAAARGTVAPLPFFVTGYLAVWSAIGIPAYFAWRELAGPLDAAAPWVGRLAGATLVTAAVYQLTPLKRACLRHCRSPLSMFVRFSGNARRPLVAMRLGLTHGAVCLGCCWALMAVLVAVGTMHIGWMAALTVVIFVEKVMPRGETFAAIAAVAFAVIGAVLLIDPSRITTIT